jgi:2-aminoadipate transaminase
MIDITVDKAGGKPLYIQIRDEIKQAIESDRLKSGDRLPTVTDLAKKIGVTPSTIRRAFEDLGKSGHTYCHVGRGTFVNDRLAPPPQETATEARITRLMERVSDAETIGAARRLRDGIKASLESMMVLAKRPGLIQFLGFDINPKLIPEDTLRKLVDHALGKDETAFYTYEDAFGLKALRTNLARYFSQSGITIKPEQILIVNGSQQAFTLLAQMALKEKLRVICETPCYLGVYKAFEIMGHWVESVPRDEEGPQPDLLARFNDGKTSLLYLCPRLHNPMGTDISRKRFQAVLDWAEKTGSILLSDEIFGDFYYDDVNPPSFLTAIESGHVYVTGSFSKTFLTGLRVGWVISGTANINNLAYYKKILDLSCPMLMQGVLNSLIVTGEYESHLKRIRVFYQSLRDEVLKALEKYMPPQVHWTHPAGGYHLWVTLPKGYSSIVLLLLAIERGVSFLPGPLKDIDHRFINAFDLSFASIEIEQVDTGIRLLADSVKELLQAPPSDHGLSGLGEF